MSPNAANYDKPKANRYAKLPDPPLLNDVKTVTTAKMWWEKRRPEIVHAFEREGYGRVPMNAPKLKLGGSLDNERGEWQCSNHYEEVGGTRRPLRISLYRGHRPDSQDASQCERSGPVKMEFGWRPEFLASLAQRFPKMNASRPGPTWR